MIPQRLKTFFSGGLLLATFAASALAQSQVTLYWSPSTDPTVKGYRLYQGGVSHNYTNVVDFGNVTQATFANLRAGSTYFFAITAYNAYGLDSPLSAELPYSVPVAPVSPPSVALALPASGTTYTAPATINLSANVTSNGHSITQVQFYNGSTLLGTDTVSPYGLAWNSVSAGTYSLTARVVYDGSSTLDSTAISVTVTNPASVLALPAPWKTADIGKVGVAGSAVASNGVFTVSGVGTIGGTADSFRFVYQPLSGDGEIRARIAASQSLNNDWAGVMIRESLTPGSAYGLMGLLSGNAVRLRGRSTTGANSRSTPPTAGTPPNLWVRLVRTGNTLTGYKSTDGVNWGMPAGRYVVPMAANIYIGLAVASGSANGSNTAAFSNLTVVP
jgi:regulation of enolase protein 1 (concanavalin A-like superfamily)